MNGHTWALRGPRHLPFLPLHHCTLPLHLLKPVYLPVTTDRGTIEGLISKRCRMGALGFLLFLVSLIFLLGRPAVPPPQSPDDGTEGNSSSLPHPGDNSVMGANAGVLASFFSGAYNFVIKNITIIVLGYDPAAKGMKALAEHSMKGAAYDSSLRDPPPHCHPGTRVQLREKIVVWFHNYQQEKRFLWLNGPAGVGKSAVIQTVAESLAESNSIGATFFFSRLNNRNDPQRVFITIAFQLATRIPEYKTYITKQIALDPSLLEKGMNDQFRIFIAEPFGKKKIGKENGLRAVLLDGLDECEGADEQCRIVRLVSGFVLNFPGAPLVWAIASRPEPHITGTFNDEAIISSCWSENMPVDSPQACRDVEHYLDASLKNMRKPFAHLPSNWPSETQFLKLSHGALGLFAFARTAIRFMEDLDHADPVSRLDLILSIINRLDISVMDDHPFALLDALYTQILTPIPPLVWQNTKRILGFVICTQSGGASDGLSYPLDPSNRVLLKMSIVLGLELSVIYSSLHKLYSVLDIPGSKNTHNSAVTFLHASFGDYLTDRARSKDFYVDRGESVDDVARSLFRLYLDKPWTTKWGQYASQLSIVARPEFYETLRKYAEDSVQCILLGILPSRRGKGPFKSQETRLECLNALGRTNPIEVYKLRFFQEERVCTFLLRLWDEFQEELKGTGLFEMVSLRDLKMELLNCGTNEIVFSRGSFPTSVGVTLRAISQSHGQPVGMKELRKHQRLYPARRAMIYGSLPEKRIAFFQDINPYGLEGYYCFPYPY